MLGHLIDDVIKAVPVEHCEHDDPPKEITTRNLLSRVGTID